MSEVAKAQEHGELDRLRERLRMLETCGIVELAVINSNVADYVRHWEGRAEAAEAKLAKAEEALKFYRDEFKVKVGRPMPGASGITYHPSEALLDDCGNRAIDALAALSPMPNKEG